MTHDVELPRWAIALLGLFGFAFIMTGLRRVLVQTIADQTIGVLAIAVGLLCLQTAYKQLKL